jgi:hypothetical protein
MSSFTEANYNEVFVSTNTKLFGRTIYRIDKDFTYYVGYIGSSIAVDVPKGTLTDGPSIPLFWLKLVKWIWGDEKWFKSATVHDILRRDLRFTRLETDSFFHMAMETEDTPVILRELAYLLVRFNRSRF